MSHRKKSFADQEVDALKRDAVMCEHEALLRECDEFLVYLYGLLSQECDKKEMDDIRKHIHNLQERITEHLDVGGTD